MSTGSVAVYAAGVVMTRNYWAACLTSRLECFLDGFKDHMSVAKTSFQGGGYRMWFDWARGVLRQVQLLKTRYTVSICYLGSSPEFNPGIWRELVILARRDLQAAGLR